MAMKDIKSIQVEPDDEESEVRLFQSFGWELKSTQEVKTQDAQIFTGQDSDGTEHYRTTRGVHYIKLTFERDPGRQNYAKLKSLEEQYYNVNNPAYPEEPIRFGTLWLIVSGIGLLIYVVPGVLVITWRLVRYSNKKKEWNEAYAVYSRELDAANAKRRDFLEKAQSLV